MQLRPLNSLIRSFTLLAWALCEAGSNSCQNFQALLDKNGFRKVLSKQATRNYFDHRSSTKKTNLWIFSYLYGDLFGLFIKEAQKYIDINHLNLIFFKQI